jgi:uncharacterized iron-regulated membrane protein
MRKYHRWTSVFFGVFLLWISVTGVLSQVGALVNNGGFEDEAAERAGPPPLPAGTPAGFVCPETLTCRPKPVETPGNWNVGFLHHIHSGEEFGPGGVVISILSGLALLFFAFSGLWMYVQMWRGRAAKSLKPGWFWK